MPPATGPAQLTLRDLFVPALQRFAERTAVVHPSGALTYRELVSQANRLALGLQGLGVGPGVPVALMMSNRVEFLIADQALIRIGAAKVPINDMQTAAEIAFILADSRAAVAIADPALLPPTPMPGLRHVITLGQPAPGAVSWNDLLADPGHGVLPPDATPGEDDVGLIIYTGGTTGRQKGVVHTQRGLAINLLAHLAELGLGDDERLLLTTPLPHAAGILTQAGLLKGGTVYLEQRFDPDRFLDRVEHDRITFTFMVPTMIYRMLDRAAQRVVDLSSLRTLLYGAAPITPDRLTDGLRRLGPVFMQLYGQTEAPNFITRLTREDHLHRPDLLTSCGRPALLMQIQVQDDHGRGLPPGQPGEVCVRGPYV